MVLGIHSGCERTPAKRREGNPFLDGTKKSKEGKKKKKGFTPSSLLPWPNAAGGRVRARKTNDAKRTPVGVGLDTRQNVGT